MKFETLFHYKDTPRRYGLTSISLITTPNLEDKFFFTTVSLGINSVAVGPPLTPNSLYLAIYKRSINAKELNNYNIASSILSLTHYPAILA